MSYLEKNVSLTIMEYEILSPLRNFACLYDKWHKSCREKGVIQNYRRLLLRSWILLKTAFNFLYIYISWSSKWSSYNLGQNICRLFHILAQFLVITSETGLDFITRKWMFELPHELPNNLRKNLGNYKKTSEMLGLDGKYSADHQKAKFWRFWQNLTKNQL